MKEIDVIVMAICAALVAATGFYCGWQWRDGIAQREALAIHAADAKEAKRQDAIHSQTEKFLREELDRANAANAGVHLGSVRCSVQLRDPSGDLQTAEGPAVGNIGSAAGPDAAAGTGRDIGPDLERWAGGQLTAERVRLRACQKYVSELTQGAVK